MTSVVEWIQERKSQEYALFGIGLLFLLTSSIAGYLWLRVIRCYMNDNTPRVPAGPDEPQTRAYRSQRGQNMAASNQFNAPNAPNDPLQAAIDQSFAQEMERIHADETEVPADIEQVPASPAHTDHSSIQFVSPTSFRPGTAFVSSLGYQPFSPPVLPAKARV